MLRCTNTRELGQPEGVPTPAAAGQDPPSRDPVPRTRVRTALPRPPPQDAPITSPWGPLFRERKQDALPPGSLPRLLPKTRDRTPPKRLPPGTPPQDAGPDAPRIPSPERGPCPVARVGRRAGRQAARAKSPLRPTGPRVRLPPAARPPSGPRRPPRSPRSSSAPSCPSSWQFGPPRRPWLRQTFPAPVARDGKCAKLTGAAREPGRRRGRSAGQAQALPHGPRPPRRRRRLAPPPQAPPIELRARQAGTANRERMGGEREPRRSQLAAVKVGRAAPLNFARARAGPAPVPVPGSPVPRPRSTVLGSRPQLPAETHAARSSGGFGGPRVGQEAPAFSHLGAAWKSDPIS